MSLTFEVWSYEQNVPENQQIFSLRGVVSLFGVVSVPFGSSGTNIIVICSDQEGSIAFSWDCEEVPARAEGGGIRVRL